MSPVAPTARSGEGGNEELGQKLAGYLNSYYYPILASSLITPIRILIVSEELLFFGACYGMAQLPYVFSSSVGSAAGGVSHIVAAR